MSTAIPTAMVAQFEAVCLGLSMEAQRWVDAPLAQLETALLAAIRKLLPQLLETLVRATQRSLSPARERQQWRCPRCGRAVRIQSWRQREVLTTCGLLRYERPWCSCQGCRHGFSPTDASLGIATYQRLSAGLAAQVTAVGATTSFAQAADLLEQLTGMRVSAETVRSTTESSGAALEVAQQAVIREVAERREAPAPLDPAPGQLVVETDGVMVRYRSTDWHEVKIALAGGYVEGKLLAKSYTAARAAPELFGPRLLAEAARRGALDIVAWEGSPLQRRLAVLRTVVVLGDGARWIWNLAAEHFSERVEIVDWYHASQHLSEVAKAVYGDGARAQQQADRWRTALSERGAAPVRRALAAVRAPTPEAMLVLRRERGYFRTNAARMAYPAFRAAGYPIGSGAIESSARHVVQQRLKRAGCRWSEAGAQSILNVCCQRASHQPAAA